MIVKILIFLVAVVVLIVIIAFLALRYLRAEDTDTFDDLPDEPRRPVRRTGDNRRSGEMPVMAAAARGPVPAVSRAGGPGQDRASAAYRDRGSQPRPTAPDRRSGPGVAQRAASPSARTRQEGQNGQEKDWDSLSDVDYWVELASEQRAAESDGPPPASRRPSGQSSNGRQHPAESRPGSRRVPAPGQSATLPARQPAPARPSGPRAAQPQPPAAQPLAAAQQNGTQPRVPRGSQSGRSGDYGRPREPESRSQHSPGRYRGIADDPTIVGSAGRARRAEPPASSLPGAPPARPPVAPPLAASAAPPLSAPPSAAARSAPSGPGYRANGRSRTHAGTDDDPLTSPSFPAITTSDSRSYRARRADAQPRSAARAPVPHTEPTQQFTSYPPDAGRPRVPDTNGSQPGIAAPVPGVGNPYGSYVSQSPAAYEPAPAGSGDASYPGAFGGAGQSLPAPTSADYPSRDGFGDYPATIPAPGPGNGGYPAANSYPPAAYPDPVGHQQPAYHAEQYDQHGYAPLDETHGLDSYQPYPGYGAR